MKIYIAGPMSGLPEFNFPAFFKKQKELEAQGWTVFNPAAKDEEAALDAEARATGDARLAVDKGFDFREAFTWDMNRVIEGDAIYMLRGWQFSPGATAEHACAVAMKKHYPLYRIIYEDAA
jgi:hypothetical protein